MDTNNTVKLFSHFPPMKELTLGLIKHAVEPVLGKDVITTLGVPHANKDLYIQLCSILIDVEKQFLVKCGDKEITGGLIDLKMADLDSIRKAFWMFAKNPATTDFPIILYKQFCKDYPTLLDNRRRNAVNLYMRLLKGELIGLNNDVREKINAVTLQEIEVGVGAIVSNTTDIVNRLDKIIEAITPMDSIARMSYQPLLDEDTSQRIPEYGKNSRMQVIYDSASKLSVILLRGLQKYYEDKLVFIFHDCIKPIAVDWSVALQRQIKNSDYIIPIISDESVYNEMLLLELQIANRLNKKIIPIRANYQLSLPYPIVEYIEDKRWIVCNEEKDIEYACQSLEKALMGVPYGLEKTSNEEVGQLRDYLFLKPTPMVNPDSNELIMDSPKGTMDSDSRFYIERDEDRLLINALRNRRSVVTIKAPRQMGKSSLLVRGIKASEKEGHKVAYLDFQRFDDKTLNDASSFYKQFAFSIIRKLNISVDVKKFWKEREDFQGNLMTCSEFVEENILSQVTENVILALDEVDRLLDCPFRSDFFGMLRSWYNDVSPNDRIWGRLSLMLVISTEPLMLISNISQSPFNIGDILEPRDFTLQQTAELNKIHGFPFDENQILGLRNLVGGHPYLLRQAMYSVCTKQFSANELLERVDKASGPFRDHLLRYLFELKSHPDLAIAMKQILERQSASSNEAIYRLESAGLVKRYGGYVVPKYGIYSSYFQEYLK